MALTAAALLLTGCSVAPAADREPLRTASPRVETPPAEETPAAPVEPAPDAPIVETTVPAPVETPTATPTQSEAPPELTWDGAQYPQPVETPEEAPADLVLGGQWVAGKTGTVTGSGYRPGEEVAVMFGREGDDVITQTIRMVADPSGKFTASIAIPEEAPGGSYRVLASSESHSQWTLVKITAAGL